jgi:hypothetical protein
MTNSTAPRHAALVLLVALVCSLALAPAAHAQADRLRSQTTAWGYLYGASTADISDQVDNDYRPISISRIAPSQYDTVLVANSGAYSVTNATVHYNLTEAQLSSALSVGGRRILDLEPYENSLGQIVFNAIAVPNSGSTAASGWAWLYNLTAADVSTFVVQNPSLRLIDIDAYTDSGVTRYAIVAVTNSGNNQVSSWIFDADASESDIASAMGNDARRVIDIEIVRPPSTGVSARYAYIAVPSDGVRSDLFLNLTDAQVNAAVEQYASRLICLERYETSGGTRFAVVLRSNTNTQTARVRDYIAGDLGEGGGSLDSNFGAGTMGFMLKEVGGPVITAINQNFVWEPASTLKLLHAVYAIDRCAAGTDNLASEVTYRNLSTSSINSACTSCPFDWVCTSRFIDLETSIQAMLEPSNNNALIALERRYGVNTLNNYADANGFGNIDILRQDCQCAVTLNTATATDICTMMEKVANGSLFSQFWQDTLYRLMNDLENQGWDLYPTLSDLINDEAAATSLTPTEIADFREAVRYANKGGYYDCGEFYKTEGGWASIPFKTEFLGSWIVFPREYVFAVYIHNTTVDSGSQIVYSAKEEILREQVREALDSWDDACFTPAVFNQPDDLTRQVGQNAVFSASLLGGGDGADFQWQKRLGTTTLWLSLSDVAGEISGTQTSTLTIIGVDTINAGEYRLRYNSVCGNTISQTATLTVVPAPACPGDTNNDNVVNFLDITTVLANFGTSYPFSTGPGDADENGVVQFLDITTVLANFGTSC